MLSATQQGQCSVANVATVVRGSFLKLLLAHLLHVLHGCLSETAGERCCSAGFRGKTRQHRGRQVSKKGEYSGFESRPPRHCVSSVAPRNYRLPLQDTSSFG